MYGHSDPIDHKLDHSYADWFLVQNNDYLNYSVERQRQCPFGTLFPVSNFLYSIYIIETELSWSCWNDSKLLDIWLNKENVKENK